MTGNGCFESSRTANDWIHFERQYRTCRTGFLGTHIARDPRATPPGWRPPRRPIGSQPGHGQVEAHRRHQVVHEALHEHATAETEGDDRLTGSATTPKKGEIFDTTPEIRSLESGSDLSIETRGKQAY